MGGTVVITGANGGMTSILAKIYHEAHPDDHLILLIRKPDSVAPGLLPAQSDSVSYTAFDMKSIQGVKSASKSIADQVNSGKLPKIKSLVCAAAIQVAGHPQPRITNDGYEETVAVNHLAHFVLLMELIPCMAKNGRIVIVGSDSHRPNYKYFPTSPRGDSHYEPLQDLLTVEPEADPASLAVANGRQRYGTSKLLQMMVGHELARRLRKNKDYSSLHVLMYDPGSMGATGLLRDRPWYERIFTPILRFTSLINWIDPGVQAALKEESAAQGKKLMEDPDVVNIEPAGINREQGGAPYFDPWGGLRETLGDTNKPELCKKLYNESVDLLGYTQHPLSV